MSASTDTFESHYTTDLDATATEQPYTWRDPFQTPFNPIISPDMHRELNKHAMDGWIGNDSGPSASLISRR